MDHLNPSLYKKYVQEQIDDLIELWTEHPRPGQAMDRIMHSAGGVSALQNLKDRLNK